MVSQALQEATKHIRLAWVGSDRASLREPLLRWGGHAHARIPKHPVFRRFQKRTIYIEFLKHWFLYPTPTTKKRADCQIDQIHSDVAYAFGVYVL